jgi:hypothetical protein
VVKEEHRPEGTYLLANLRQASGAALVPFASSDPWARDEED